MAEDRKEPPFQDGAQPVPHQKDPLPGPGRAAAQGVTVVVGVLIVAALVMFIFWR